MKPFTARISQLLEQQGYNVEEQPKNMVVDLIATRYGVTRAFRVKPHGNLPHAEMRALRGFGMKNKMPVLIASELAGHNLSFFRVYPRNKKV